MYLSSAKFSRPTLRVLVHRGDGRMLCTVQLQFSAGKEGGGEQVITCPGVPLEKVEARVELHSSRYHGRPPACGVQWTKLETDYIVSCFVWISKVKDLFIGSSEIF